ncbi:MAG: hypothetical protein KGI80_00755 [Verrucomicrobiota bacterium]|nr:hypothetical protein [Verrucomicrobiota bacterium]
MDVAQEKSWKETLLECKAAEERIVCGLGFMREALSREGLVRFRDFWEMRREILPLFKENISGGRRHKLWEEYVDLTVEARCLKKKREEEGAFAMEQLEIALQALEQEVEAGLIKEALPKEGLERYSSLQRELELLGVWTKRTQALRKDVVAAVAHLNWKSKLLDRLGKLGDLLFPRRRSLLGSAHQEFEQEVARFVKDHFSGEEIAGAPLHRLKDEVKALQEIAKGLALPADLFHRLRQDLSSCWERVHGVEKEAVAKRREEEEKERVEEEARRKVREEERAKEKKMQEKRVAWREQCVRFQKEPFTDQELEELRREVAREGDKREWTLYLSRLEHLAAERREKEDGNLPVVLQQKKERRQKLKAEYDLYRKELGGSNLSFERAMQLREWIDWGKEQLDLLEEKILEMEE